MNADDISVSLVRSWNVEEIVSLYRAGGWWKDEFDPAEIPGLINGSFAFVVAADKKTGHAVGMGRVISDGVSDAYIQDLVVLPSVPSDGSGDCDSYPAHHAVQGCGYQLDRACCRTRLRAVLSPSRVCPDGGACSPDIPG